MTATHHSPRNDAERERPRSLVHSIVIVLVAAALVAGCYAVIQSFERQDQLTQVSAPPGRMVLGVNDAADLQAVNRAALPEVYYHVVLQQAPLGRGLDIDCLWIDPTGKVAHQNHYTTQPIDKPLWPTHARWQCNAASPLGKWIVRMMLDGRLLSERTFDLQEEKP